MSKRGDDDENKDLLNSVDHNYSASRCGHSVWITRCSSNSNSTRFCHSFIKFYHDEYSTSTPTWSCHTSARSDRCRFSSDNKYNQYLQ